MAGALAVTLAGVLAAPTLGQPAAAQLQGARLPDALADPAGHVGRRGDRISVAACKDLQKIDGVRNCGAHIGQALLADEVYGVDFGENWISVDPAVDYDTALADVQHTVEAYPGLYRDVQTYLRERIKEVLTGSSESIVVRVYGPDLARAAREGEGDRGQRSPASRGSPTRTPRCRPTCRTSRSSRTSRPPAGTA